MADTMAGDGELGTYKSLIEHVLEELTNALNASTSRTAESVQAKLRLFKQQVQRASGRDPLDPGLAAQLARRELGRDDALYINSGVMPLRTNLGSDAKPWLAPDDNKEALRDAAKKGMVGALNRHLADRIDSAHTALRAGMALFDWLLQLEDVREAFVELATALDVSPQVVNAIQNKIPNVLVSLLPEKKKTDRALFADAAKALNAFELLLDERARPMQILQRIEQQLVRQPLVDYHADVVRLAQALVAVDLDGDKATAGLMPRTPTGCDDKDLPLDATDIRSVLRYAKECAKAAKKDDAVPAAWRGTALESDVKIETIIGGELGAGIRRKEGIVGARAAVDSALDKKDAFLHVHRGTPPYMDAMARGLDAPDRGEVCARFVLLRGLCAAAGPHHQESTELPYAVPGDGTTPSLLPGSFTLAALDDLRKRAERDRERHADEVLAAEARSIQEYKAVPVPSGQVGDKALTGDVQRARWELPRKYDGDKDKTLAHAMASAAVREHVLKALEGETGDDTKTMQAVRAAAKLAQLSDLATVANAMPGRLPSWMGPSDKAIRPPKVCESGEVLWAVDAGLQKADTGAPPAKIAHDGASFEPDELTAWLRSALAYEGVAPRLSLLPLSPKAAAATALPTRVFGNFGNVNPDLVTLASLRAACTGSIAAIEDCIGAGHEETVAKRWEAFAGGDYPRPDLEQGARSMRTTMWKDALREVTVAQDPLMAFVRTLSGTINEAAQELLEVDPELMRTQKRIAERQRATGDATLRFQTKLIESVMNSALKQSRLQIDIPKNGVGGLQVSRSDAKEVLRDLADGQSGRPFFDNQVELQNALNTSSEPIPLLSLIEEFNDIARNFDRRVASAGVDQAASLQQVESERVADPKHLLIVRFKDEVRTAIYSAYRLVMNEMSAQERDGKGRFKRYPRLIEFCEGPSHNLTQAFCEFAGTRLQGSRMESTSQAQYVTRDQRFLSYKSMQVSLMKCVFRVNEYVWQYDGMPPLRGAKRTAETGTDMGKTYGSASTGTDGDPPGDGPPGGGPSVKRPKGPGGARGGFAPPPAPPPPAAAAVSRALTTGKTGNVGTTTTRGVVAFLRYTLETLSRDAANLSKAETAKIASLVARIPSSAVPVLARSLPEALRRDHPAVYFWLLRQMALQERKLFARLAWEQARSNSVPNCNAITNSAWRWLCKTFAAGTEVASANVDRVPLPPLTADGRSYIVTPSERPPASLRDDDVSNALNLFFALPPWEPWTRSGASWTRAKTAEDLDWYEVKANEVLLDQIFKLLPPPQQLLALPPPGEDAAEPDSPPPGGGGALTDPGTLATLVERAPVQPPFMALAALSMMAVLALGLFGITPTYLLQQQDKPVPLQMVEQGWVAAAKDVAYIFLRSFNPFQAFESAVAKGTLATTHVAGARRRADRARA